MGEVGEGSSDQAVEPELELGTDGQWEGLPVYVLAASLYLLALLFEAIVSQRMPGGESALAGWPVAAGPTAAQTSAAMEWRAAVLLLIGTGIGTVLVCVRTLLISLRRSPRPVIAMLLIVTLVAIATAAIRAGGRSTSVLTDLCSRLAADSPRFTAHGLDRLILLPKTLAEAAAGTVGLAMASLLALPPKLSVRALAERVRTLRLILYFTAAMLVSGVVMIRTSYGWAMTWYEPAEGQAEMIASGTALAGAFYTLMLGAIYLPCALVLSRRAQDLARHAVASGAGETPDGWLESNDLQVSWRGNTGRILAVVSPMLTAVVPAWSSLLGG